MPTFNEPMHTGEFLLTELPFDQSRENVIVASGQVLEAGTVIGLTTALPAAVAGSANVGNGTVAVTQIGQGAQIGSYGIRFTAPTAFDVTAPDSASLGSGTTGVAFTAGGVTFTITAGATPFAAGDTFALPVARGLAKAWVPGASDGSQVVAGLNLPRVDAAGGAKRCAAVVRGATVTGRHLMYAAGTTEAQKETAKAGLRALGILAR